ncbi:MAG: class I SAM-dependent methyltransferase [Spirochaetales bacterium]|nr:class I SAM-dependent methyltransferase [Spirochaetales bacterium]
MDKTQKSYNQFAAKYNDKFSIYEPYQKQMNKYVSCFKEKSKILDVGCGSGLNSKIISEAGHKIIGFDFSESMIEIAKKNCPRGVFYVSTTENFNSSEMFDGICLSFIIVHLSDQDAYKLIDKVSRLLNPGGYLYISFMTGKQPGYETTSFSDSEIFFNYYKTEDIIEKFTRNGFSVESREIEPYTEKDGSTTEDVFLIFKRNL